ncbi:hypothetical protein [Marinirhabdus gelatinilytica]|uniref:Calcineurin-like phosphoesterase family protein n=1 Tax=Marinirhabdus gelatinilytica TaxID=1703343 RepID=A0A370QGI6_9FLAO|nr:hypothetical protein [Marinirhabdus gelatinilytica]RDK87170.1 hypothetical protein C8D94_102353 [Marinirhabdus gelatinilytica]
MQHTTQKIIYRLTSIFIGIFIISACASYKEQKATSLQETTTSKSPTHTFFIAGGLGNYNGTYNDAILSKLQQKLNEASKNSTLLFTGNYTSKDFENEEQNLQLLKKQLDLANSFKGKTYFIPGTNEWESKNAKQIEWVEDYIKDQDLKKVEVEPNNVCPLEYREINDAIDMILVDSKWYISNWDRVEYINQKCSDIKTQRRFIEELEGMIKDARGKNLVIVMSHPIFSNGMYANNYKGGMNPDKIYFQRYQEFAIKVAALVQELDRVTLVSGHENSLQYLTSKDRAHQVISGSLGKASKTKREEARITAVGGQLIYEGQYTYGKEGFGMIQYFEDGSSQVTFITEEGEKTFPMTAAFPNDELKSPMPPFTSQTVQVPIVSEEEKLEKSGFYKFMWGDRFRKYYGIPVTATNADLTKYRGGLTVKEAGGGHQTYSAKLKDENGAEYAIRGLEKDAFKFLKFKVKGITFEPEEYRGTFAETVVYDFFTTTHPFMQLVLDPMAKEINVNHANIELAYVPKQPNLDDLGEKYGDALYWIEERPDDGQEDFEGYNRANPGGGTVVTFESATDVLEKLREDEKYSVDQKIWIRSRLFDMLIGDWDRHQDQWRFAEYEIDDDTTRFIPIPRDRDAAFSKFDGVMLTIVKMVVPDTRFWQSYKDDIRDIKWYNGEGNNLDRTFMTKFGTDAWIEQARYIQQHLSEAEIDAAWENLPPEVQDETSERLKSDLKSRLGKLDQYAKEYGNYLNRTVAIHGTDKDDKFEIIRLEDGKTQVIIKRAIKDEKDPVILDRTFDKDETKEIWIYGLNDDDEFTVTGRGNNPIKVRIIGGYGKDKYTIENTRQVKVYDWKYEDSKFDEKTPAHQFTNLYETNTYHWRYFKENNHVILPNIGFQVDDGFFLGARDTYTNYGFNGNPFRYQHALLANYYFNFQAVELDYDGEFANIFPQWNLVVDGYFTSDSFANQFFGFGNGTSYDGNADDEDRDFNRARMQQIKASAGVKYKTLTFKALFESFEVQNNPDRLFTPSTNAVNSNVFEMQNYAGGEALISYRNQNAMDFPSKAFNFDAVIGYKSNIEDSDNAFGYAGLQVGFEEGLIPSGNLVLGTSAAVRTNIGDNYYFYHAPSIGGNNGLRGYRNERFTGETSFYHTTDLKLRLARLTTSVIPITLGTYGGFDYGRVWSDVDTSDTMHTSFGGGIWLSGLNSLAFKAGYFVSEEDQIIQVGLLITQ